MTNKEKLQEIFPNMIFTGTVMMYKPTEQVLASRINYNWLNIEYEEPTTENCIACKYDETEEEDGEHCKKCLAGDNQFELDKEFVEPTTKNDLGVDCISRDEVCRYVAEFGNHEFSTREEEELIDNIITGIEHLPSVTPQESRIITCKECKYYRNKGNKYSYCTKRLNVDSITDRYREPNFYCADAVLREVEE